MESRGSDSESEDSSKSRPPATRMRGEFIAISVTLATAYLYLVTYLYERGYCSAFGVPAILVRPDLSAVLGIGGIAFAVIGVLAVPALGVFPFFYAAFAEWPKHTFRRVLLYALPGLVSTIVVLLAYPEKVASIALLLIPVVLLLPLFEVLSAWRRTRKNRARSFDQNLSDVMASFPSESDLPVVLIKKFGLNPMLFAWIAYSVVSLAYAAGLVEANWQNSFPVIRGDREWAVVRVYGDSAIAVGLVGTPRQLSGAVCLMKLESVDGAMTRRDVGRIALRAKAVADQLENEALKCPAERRSAP